MEICWCRDSLPCIDANQPKQELLRSREALIPFNFRVGKTFWQDGFASGNCIDKAIMMLLMKPSELRTSVAVSFKIDYDFVLSSLETFGTLHPSPSHSQPQVSRMEIGL